MRQVLWGALVVCGALALVALPGCQGTDGPDGCGCSATAGGSGGGCGCADGCGCASDGCGCASDGCGGKAGCGCGDGCGCSGCGCGCGCGGAAKAGSADTRHAMMLAKSYQKFTKTNARAFTSKPHGRHKIHNWANAIAKSTFASGKGNYRPGAVIAKEGWKSGKRNMIWLMEKRGSGYDSENGDWWYATVTADGKVKNAGKVSMCIDCHSGADNDYVFGNP
ncbi:MAG: cytochrome P460 family protein [Planctomycetota bacterium]|nr:cytochrome P460 family protein [Planctomycetota bacterium]